MLTTELAGPLSSQRLPQLDLDLRHICDSLPKAVDDKFPRPVHSAYPDQAQRNDTLVGIINGTHARAAGIVAKLTDGVEWYRKLCQATLELSDAVQDAERSIEALHQSLQALNFEYGTSACSSATDLGVAQLQTWSSWLDNLPDHLKRAQIVHQEATVKNQCLALHVLKSRRIVKDPPKSIRLDVGAPHAKQLVEDAEAMADDLAALIHKAAEYMSAAQTDLQILPQLQSCLHAAGSIDANLANDLRQNTCDTFDEMERQVSLVYSLEKRHREEVSGVIAQSEEAFRRQGRELPRIHAHTANLSLCLKKELQDIRLELQTRLAIAKQRKVVGTIDHEAKCLQTEITALQSAIADTADQGLPTSRSQEARIPRMPEAMLKQVEEIQSRVGIWTTSLPLRVTFLASASANDALGASSSTDHTQLHTSVEASDTKTRARVNDAAGRVGAAISALIDETTTFPQRAWAIEARRTISMVDSVLASVKTHLPTDRCGAATSDLTSSRLFSLSAKAERLITLDGCLGSGHRSPYHLETNAGLQRVSDDLKDLLQSLEESHILLKSSDAADDLPVLSLLLERLETLRLDEIVRPSIWRSDSTIRSFPSFAVAKAIREEVEDVAAKASAPLASHRNVQEQAILKTAIERCQADLPRLDSLAAAGLAVIVVDRSFSRLLDACDAYEGSQAKDQLDALKASAQKALGGFFGALEGISDDPRILAERARLETSWMELDALVDDLLPSRNRQTLSSEQASSAAESRESSHLPISSLGHPKRLGSILASASPNRSHPPHARSMTTSPALEDVQRARTVSETLASGSEACSKLPRMRNTSLGSTSRSSSPRTAAVKAHASPRHSFGNDDRRLRFESGLKVTASTGNLRAQSSTTIDRQSRVTTVASRPARLDKAYVPNPRNKLDIAVGKVVNKLNVSFVRYSLA